MKNTRHTPVYCAATGVRLTKATKTTSPVGRHLTVTRKAANTQRKALEAQLSASEAANAQ